MIIQIFKSYEDFAEREDKSINGVCEGFSEINIDYVNDNSRNTGCWNCIRCTDCTDCTDCTGCRGCTDLTDRNGCTDCTRCKRYTDVNKLTGFLKNSLNVTLMIIIVILVSEI